MDTKYKSAQEILGILKKHIRVERSVLAMNFIFVIGVIATNIDDKYDSRMQGKWKW